MKRKAKRKASLTLDLTSRSVVETAIERSKDQRTETWEGVHKRSPRKIPLWGKDGAIEAPLRERSRRQA